VLSERPGEVVSLVRERAGGRRVVVRTVQDARQLGSELALLSRMRSPRLAALVDAGTLPGGGAYLARAWIEGVDLASTLPLAPQAAAEVVHQVLLALEELHRQGFAHGDLKPANLVRTSTGEVVLTDFGLARRARGRAAPTTLAGATGAASAGTLGFVAPEVLVGAVAGPGADLFSLGVTWLVLLGAELPPPSRLYGRFPAERFIDAAELALEALPGDTRDLLVELLHRAPTARPTSAAAFARRVAARFGFAVPAPTARPERPYWSHLAGREEFVQRSLTELAARGGVAEWHLPSQDEAAAFAREVALVHAVRGAAVQHVELGAELGPIRDSVQLDRWFARLEQRAAAATLVIGGSAEPWTGELGQALPSLTLARGAVLCSGPKAVLPTSGTHVPGQDRHAVRTLLARALSGAEAEVLDLLTETLHAEVRGSSDEAATRVGALFAGGLVVDAGDGARLAEGVDPRECVRNRPRTDERAVRALDENARRLLLVLHVLGPCSPADVAAVAGAVEPESILASLAGRNHVHITAEDGVRRVRENVGHSALELGLDRSVRRELYTALSAHQRRNGGPIESAWASDLLSGRPSAVEEVTREAHVLLERRLSSRVRLGLERARALARREGEPLPLALARVLALAKLRSDDVEGARVEAGLFGASEPARRAASGIEARIARGQGDYERAAQLFALAGDEAEALEARVQRAYYAGDAHAVEGFALEYRRSFGDRPNEALGQAVYVDVLAGAALSALRVGEVERARYWIGLGTALAERSDNLALVGAVALNSGTVLRRLGDLRGGLAQYERAVEAYRRLGLASILAQARLAYSGALREVGRVAEAEPLVLEALGTRRRLGDLPGAATARGMYGLVLADRGHLHAASIELEGAAETLARQGRADQADVVLARLAEVRARLGQAAPEAPAQAEPRAGVATQVRFGDPRVPLGLARAAWCRGLRDAARELLARAAHDARAAGRLAEADEADWLLAELSGAPGPPPTAPDGRPESLADEDRRIVAYLRTEWFDGRATLDRARELVQRGRDDRGARLALAVAARDVDPVRRERAASLARSALERALAGAAPGDAARVLQHLLGFPDPWPADLARWRAEPEDEMDVLTVLGINERLVEQQDLDTLLGAIVDAAIEVTGAERGFLVLEEDGVLSLDQALDSSRGDLAPDEVEYSQSIVHAALERSGPLRIADAGEDVMYGAARSVTTFALRSVLCQPFDVDQGVRGVVVVDDRRRPGAFGPREERLLGLLAGQAALAVRQVRRLESISRLRDELAARVVERETRLEVVERRLEARGQVPPVEGLVGESAVMQAVHKLLRRIAPSDLPVLVSGESGTGKEVAARALHSLSPRVKGPFIAENCAALPASLLESELFGSRKGSYTGAERDREGLFERAHGGTLFLDEIGELPLDQQAKLLRVLETHEVRRIGDTETRSVDFRLVAATNRDLAVEVREGRFREDLMYRLDTVRIVMPPLRDRLEDLPALVAHFLRLAAAKDGRLRRVSPEVQKALAARAWPGNVRELANEVARLLVLSDGDVDDPSLVRQAARPETDTVNVDLVRPLEELEREAIMAALQRTGGDKRRAAELLGISRAKIYQRLKEWRME
jgi:serine/threonine-protein kinase PknK